MSANKFGIAIHGGAGTIIKSELNAELELKYKTALQESILIGYKILESGGSSLDAVQESVIYLEDCPLFNAGRGSVFTHQGDHEMDASIMDGSRIDGGAVALLKKIKNPIKLARLVLDHSEHAMIVGDGAEEFAKQYNLEFVGKDYFFTGQRYEQLLTALKENTILLDHISSSEKKFGTVGAVALDQFGNLASATSTGGMTNKKWGRVGDTPILGAGTYANNKSCAVSCTGSGEYFIRMVVAFHVHALMSYGNYTLQEACHKLIHELLPGIKGDGGLIAIDTDANVVMDFNTEGMYRGLRTSELDLRVEIYK